MIQPRSWWLGIAALVLGVAGFALQIVAVVTD